MRGAGQRPRLVLATRNPGKIRELRAIYGHIDIAWRSLADYPGIGDLPEEGATYAENARAKARAVADTTGLPALADDSGIEIDALGGAPGIHSARFAGADATDAERNARILALLEGVPAGQRTARYRASVAVALPGGPVRVFEGVCQGSIAPATRGTGGFGYDPIFVPAGESRTMAEVPADVKNRLSHRARALRAAEPYVTEALRRPGEDRGDGPPNNRGGRSSPGIRKEPGT